MKSVNRKVEQFVKNKEASARKAKPVAPHLTYKVTHLPTSATVNTSRKSASRPFSMTVSFFNPRFEKGPGDHLIRHACNQQRMVDVSPDRMFSPKRDPILQNNEETVHEPKPTIRCFSTNREAPPETVDYAFLSKGRGEYNQVDNPVNPEAKPSGKRTNITRGKQSEDEQPRRLRRGVVNSSLQMLNPIIQGYRPDGEKLNKQRSPPEVSEETKRLNAKLLGMTTLTKANSPKGRVFWDSSITLTMEDSVERTPQNYKSRQSLQGFQTQQKSFSQSTQSIEPAAKRHRRNESMEDVITYKHALPYRDQVVTRKCNQVPVSEIMNTTDY